MKSSLVRPNNVLDSKCKHKYLRIDAFAVNKTAFFEITINFT